MWLSCSLQVCQGKSGSSGVSSPLSAWEERVSPWGVDRLARQPAGGKGPEQRFLSLRKAGAPGFITAQGTTTIHEERSSQASSHHLCAGDSPDGHLPSQMPNRQPLGCQGAPDVCVSKGKAWGHTHNCSGLGLLVSVRDRHPVHKVEMWTLSLIPLFFQNSFKPCGLCL